MGVGVHLLQRHGSQVASVAQRMAPAIHAQQLAPLDHVRPVKAAGVGNRQQDLGILRQRGQRLQRLHRDVGGAEEHDPPGNRHLGSRAGFERRQKAAVQLRAGGVAGGFAQRRQQLPPQGRLPALVRRDRPGIGGAVRGCQHVVTGRPGGEPVAAVDLVLIEEVRQALGQLQAAAHVALLQEAGQGLEARLRHHPGQDLHQLPGQRQLVQRRCRRDRVTPQDLAIGAPEEAGREFDAGGSGDAGVGGQRHLEPLGYAVALDEEGLFFQWPKRGRAKPLEDGLGQGLGAVAVEDQEAGGHVTCHSS